MQKHSLKRLLSLFGPALVFALAFTTPATATPLEEGGHKQIQVKKVVVKCDDGNDGNDGDDCEQKVHVVLQGDGAGDSDAKAIAVVNTLGEHFAYRHHGGHGGHGGHARAGVFLGVGLTELTPELRRHFGVPEEAGVLVSKVLEESPALTAGIEVGDIITAVNDQPVGSARSLQRAIHSLEAGEVSKLEVWRDGRVEVLSATVAEPKDIQGLPRLARRVVVRCDDENGEDGDCGFDWHQASGFHLACGGDDCEIAIDCKNGECDCVVNGEAADCATLHP